jgi:hypothetical protein
MFGVRFSYETLDSAQTVCATLREWVFFTEWRAQGAAAALGPGLQQSWLNNFVFGTNFKRYVRRLCCSVTTPLEPPACFPDDLLRHDLNDVVSDVS